MTNRPILFLDIDGVCNNHAGHPRTRYCSTDKSCVAHLDRILTETGAGIVLTSSWRYLVHCGAMTLDGLRYLLHTHWIDGAHLIGITRRDITDGIEGVEPRTDRGPQITEWLRAHPWARPYVVLDNMDLEIRSESHPFVQTDEDVGLTEADADRVIAILNGVETDEMARSCAATGDDRHG